MGVLLLVVLLQLAPIVLSKRNSSNLPNAIFMEERLVEELSIGQTVLNLNKAVSQHKANFNNNTNQFSSESIVFTLIPTEQHEYFRVSSNQDLVVAKRIDRETICERNEEESCVLRIQLNALHITEPRSRTRLITIFVKFILEDINDNLPICQPPMNAVRDDHYSVPTVEVPEDMRVNAILTTWSVTDADSPKYGIQGFRLIAAPSHESNEEQFSLDVSEITHKQRPWSKATFQLRLNRPFKKQAPTNSRNTKLLGEFLIKYALWDSVNEPTDFSPSHRTICHLRVHVLDVNNHSPEWISPQEFKFSQPIRIDIKEGKMNGLGSDGQILKLEAKDEDVGLNSRIQYLIIVGADKALITEGLLTNIFHLDPRTGVLRIRRFPLDYEAVSRMFPLKEVTPTGTKAAGIRFFVKAVDSPKDESQQRSSSVGEIILYVHDVNDCPPKITILPISLKPSFSHGGKNTLSVRENLPSLEPIATVTVEDPDTGRGGRVKCDLIEGPSKNATASHFRLIETSFPDWTTRLRNVGYQILTAGPLDREEQGSHELRLICVDGDGNGETNQPRLTSVVGIHVRVQDENDHAPEASPKENNFLSDGTTVTCQVAENVKPGTKVCQLKALDADEGENAVIEWTVGNDTPAWLKVDLSSGWLLVSGPGGPDREMAERHNFSIIAIDGRRGGTRLSSTIPVSLEVTDVNDHPPEIGPFFYFTISEAAPPGTIIGRLNATDGDKQETENAALAFSIVGMRLHDPKRTTRLEFSEQSTPWVPSSIGVTKHRIPVMLDEETGEISVGPDGLDREMLESFELLVEVIDGQKRGRSKKNPKQWSPNCVQLTAQATVQISIQDVNDNQPKFIFPRSNTVGKVTLTCGDALHLPRVVFQVVANDSDKGLNSDLEYSLVFDNATSHIPTNRILLAENRTNSLSNEAPWFEIESRSGEISLVSANEILTHCQSADKKPKKDLGVYGFVVSVTDKGEPRLSATASVQVSFTSSDYESFSKADSLVSNPTGRSSAPSTTASELEVVSRVEALLPPGGSLQRWTLEGAGENTNYEALEPQANDRFAIFSSPTAFWAATICLGMATTILLALICAFIFVAFRRRNKPIDDRERLPSDDIYPNPSKFPGAPVSACLSTDSETIQTRDSKTFQPTPQPENGASKRIRICYTGSTTEAGLYEWQQEKFDSNHRSPDVMDKQKQEVTAHRYSRIKQRENTGLNTDMVRNTFDVYQPLLRIAKISNGDTTEQWLRTQNTLAAKMTKEDEGENVELVEATTSALSKKYAQPEENLTKIKLTTQKNIFETSFV